MSNTDETYKFINEGGDFLNYFGYIKIISIDAFRVDNIKIIQTTNEKYYINTTKNKFHEDYPTTSENEIKDKLYCSYLIERIEHYIAGCEEDIIRNKNLLCDIKQIETDYNKYVKIYNSKLDAHKECSYHAFLISYSNNGWILE